MMSWKEKERLQALLKYLEHQQIADQYQTYLFNQNSNILPVMTRQSKIDVSNRLRDDQGRFLPYNYQIMGESKWISDEEQNAPRDLTIKPIVGSYNSYLVDEKEKRDWSGNIYLVCVVTILAIAFFA